MFLLTLLCIFLKYNVYFVEQTSIMHKGIHSNQETYILIFRLVSFLHLLPEYDVRLEFTR